MQGFISGLALPEGEKARLLALTPAGYTGLAEQLARRWSEGQERQGGQR